MADISSGQQAHPLITLDEATRLRATNEGKYELEVPDGWQQGRGAYGGLTIASLVRAIEHFVDSPDRALRSLTAELPGPTLVGPAELSVEAARVGSGQSTVIAKLVQQGETRAVATGVLAKPRAVSVEPFCALDAPKLRPWQELQPLSLGGLGPPFARNFEYRSDGPYPFTGGREAYCEGWVKPNAPGNLSTASYLAAMCDAWWPSLFSRTTAPMAIGTVAFTMQIVSSLTLDKTSPLAYRGRVWVQSEGWFIEQRELWTASGQLLALNQQTFAIIK